MENNNSIPVLIPVEADIFWQQIRLIIREEIDRGIKEKPKPAFSTHTEGLTQKPLYKMHEICELFHITRPTIYDWIKHGKLRPFKVRSRVYFLHSDIQQLLAG